LLPGDPDPQLAHPEAAGWVLGVLDGFDAERFGGHLRSCPDCQAAVRELGPAARILHSAAPAGLPPPGLQARTLASVAQAAAAAQRDAVPGQRDAVPAQRDAVPAQRGEKRSRWRGWNVRMLALAAAVVLAAAVGAGLALSRAPSAETYTMALHSQSGQPASGQAVATHTDSGWSIQLTVTDLADLGNGGFYECWWVGPGNRPGHPDLISAGTFIVGPSGSATAHMWTAADPDTFKSMQITAETTFGTGQPGHSVLTGTAADS
jgi:Anti-sigma-K factor rskA